MKRSNSSSVIGFSPRAAATASNWASRSAGVGPPCSGREEAAFFVRPGSEDVVLDLRPILPNLSLVFRKKLAMVKWPMVAAQLLIPPTAAKGTNRNSTIAGQSGLTYFAYRILSEGFARGAPLFRRPKTRPSPFMLTLYLRCLDDSLQLGSITMSHPPVRPGGNRNDGFHAEERRLTPRSEALIIGSDEMTEFDDDRTESATM